MTASCWFLPGSGGNCKRRKPRHRHTREMSPVGLRYPLSADDGRPEPPGIVNAGQRLVGSNGRRSSRARDPGPWPRQAARTGRVRAIRFHRTSGDPSYEHQSQDCRDSARCSAARREISAAVQPVLESADVRRLVTPAVSGRCRPAVEHRRAPTRSPLPAGARHDQQHDRQQPGIADQALENALDAIQRGRHHVVDGNQQLHASGSSGNCRHCRKAVSIEPAGGPAGALGKRDALLPPAIRRRSSSTPTTAFRARTRPCARPGWPA